MTYTSGNNWGAGPQSAEVQSEDCISTKARELKHLIFSIYYWLDRKKGGDMLSIRLLCKCRKVNHILFLAIKTVLKI